MIFVMKCSMMNILEKFTISEMQMTVFLVLLLKEVYVTSYGIESKKGYAKRRLTHTRYLSVYFNLLKDGGALRFKTDNVGLFDFSLECIAEMGLECSKLTRDLHASEYNEGNIMTEYETAFSSQGVPINMLEVIKPCGFAPKIEDGLMPGARKMRQKMHKNTIEE